MNRPLLGERLSQIPTFGRRLTSAPTGARRLGFDLPLPVVSDGARPADTTSRRGGITKRQ